MQTGVWVYHGKELGEYGFPNGHPFGPGRQACFWEALCRQGLDQRCTVRAPVMASQEQIERFHTHEYVERVKRYSATGTGYLDAGDTPAFPGVYEAAAYVVGSALDAMGGIMQRKCQTAFVPIAGLHHAARRGAAGFCVFNDCGVVIETLRQHHRLARIAYVDIDAHHGDGVCYGFIDQPGVWIADIHEDGRYLYPGTGRADETGDGTARGTKLNLPMQPGSGDQEFKMAWTKVETFIHQARPEFIVLQCGVDSLAGDPLTHLGFSEQSHYHAALRLTALAKEYAQGRLLAVGGGGYAPENIARGWTAVVKALIESAHG
ncbi:MAG: acetoin utilization protein AcuC [Pseudomonadota bacterium]